MEENKEPNELKTTLLSVHESKDSEYSPKEPTRNQQYLPPLWVHKPSNIQAKLTRKMAESQIYDKDTTPPKTQFMHYIEVIKNEIAWRKTHMLRLLYSSIHFQLVPLLKKLDQSRADDDLKQIVREYLDQMDLLAATSTTYHVALWQDIRAALNEQLMFQPTAPWPKSPPNLMRQKGSEEPNFPRTEEGLVHKTQQTHSQISKEIHEMIEKQAKKDQEPPTTTPTMSE